MTVTAMAQTHVAQTTSGFEIRLFCRQSCSPLTRNCSSSAGSFTNSKTSTSQRNLTFDDSLLQNRWPLSLLSKHQIGSDGTTKQKKNKNWKFQMKIPDNFNLLPAFSRCLRDENLYYCQDKMILLLLRPLQFFPDYNQIKEFRCRDIFVNLNFMKNSPRLKTNMPQNILEKIST